MAQKYHKKTFASKQLEAKNQFERQLSPFAPCRLSVLRFIYAIIFTIMYFSLLLILREINITSFLMVTVCDKHEQDEVNDDVRIYCPTDL